MAEHREVATDLEAEQKHFQDVFKAFAFYRVFATRRIDIADSFIHALPERHLAILQPRIGERQMALRKAIDVNFAFIKEILRSSKNIFENSSVSRDVPTDSGLDCSGTEDGITSRGPQSPAPAANSHKPQGLFKIEPSQFTMEKVATTLKQFYRDWSKEGEEERNACYLPLIKELEKFCPLPTDGSPHPPRVLVPGAGLGRLAFEIARRGYECEGNEFSLHMLFGSNFIINRPAGSSPVTIHPWVLQFCNNMSTADQVGSVSIPDVAPSSVESLSRFSMCAGDFLEAYHEPECFNCVVTCFFIDTAHNPIEYIEVIHKILVPGGYWINLGPLLWHWADIHGEQSIELSYEDLRHIITETFGFILHNEQSNVRSGYIQNPASMLKSLYDCVLFVAQKPVAVS